MNYIELICLVTLWTVYAIAFESLFIQTLEKWSELSSFDRILPLMIIIMFTIYIIGITSSP